MADPRFIMNNHSNIAHKELDLSTNLPLAPGATFYTEQIPSSPWRSKGMEILLNTLNSQITITTQVSFDRTDPRRYTPAFHPVISDQLEYIVSSTSTDPGAFSLTVGFDGDWLRYAITNTGITTITDLIFVAVLADSPNLS